jgi:hypothetical protein
MQELIVPIAGMLLEALPILWDLSEECNVLRGSLVALLNTLAFALGNRSIEIEAFICNVLNFAINPSVSGNLYLLEPGLDLWQTILRNSSEISIRLGELFAFWPTIFEYNLEFLHQMLEILESYILLGKSEFVVRFADILGSALSEAIGMFLFNN